MCLSRYHQCDAVTPELLVLATVLSGYAFLLEYFLEKKKYAVIDSCLWIHRNINSSLSILLDETKIHFCLAIPLNTKH